jgi:hypothetical protein
MNSKTWDTSMQDHAAFPDLPIPDTTTSEARLTGVEIEFAGLDEVTTAKLIADAFGGRVEEDGAHGRTVRDTSLGDIKVELDTALRKVKGVPLLEEGLSLARGLVPVEIVTPPLTMDGLDQFDAFLSTLRKNGAQGSRAGILLGFGVHLNPEVVGPDHPHTLNTILAYALLEHWLRKHEAVDGTRRMLPFVRAWPDSFVLALIEEAPTTLSDLMRLAAGHITSRNHGLDILPLLKHHDPDLFKSMFPDDTLTSARPTFHFRLPDSRIDEPDWSLAQPWALWHRIEMLATDASKLAALSAAKRSANVSVTHGAWINVVDAILLDVPSGAA